MVTIAIEQFEKNPSDAIRRVEAGETLLIVRNSTPIAEFKPARKMRPIGLASGQFRVPDDFNAPLPTETLDTFEGQAES